MSIILDKFGISSPKKIEVSPRMVDGTAIFPGFKDLLYIYGVDNEDSSNTILSKVKFNTSGPHTYLQSYNFGDNGKPFPFDTSPVRRMAVLKNGNVVAFTRENGTYPVNAYIYLFDKNLRFINSNTFEVTTEGIDTATIRTWEPTRDLKDNIYIARLLNEAVVFRKYTGQELTFVWESEQLNLAGTFEAFRYLVSIVTENRLIVFYSNDYSSDYDGHFASISLETGEVLATNILSGLNGHFQITNLPNNEILFHTRESLYVLNEDVEVQGSPITYSDFNFSNTNSNEGTIVLESWMDGSIVLSASSSQFISRFSLEKKSVVWDISIVGRIWSVGYDRFGDLVAVVRDSSTASIGTGLFLINKANGEVVYSTIPLEDSSALFDEPGLGITFFTNWQLDYFTYKYGLIDTPANFSVSVANDNADFSWDAVKKADGYNLYFDSGNGYVKKNSSLITTNSYSLEGLADATRDAYVVSVKDDIESLASNIVQFTTEAVDPPVINSFSAEAGDSKVTLTWDIDETTGTLSAVEYEIDGSGTWNALTTQLVGSEDVTGLNNGQEYSFRLRATTEDGQAVSDPVTATPVAVFFKDFSGDTVGAAPAGVTQEFVDGITTPWTIFEVRADGDQFDSDAATGGKLLLADADFDGDDIGYSFDGLSYQDVEVYCRFELASTGDIFSIMLRASGNQADQTHYDFQYWRAGPWTRITKWISGARTVILQGPDKTLDHHNWLDMRCRVQGNALKMKVWQPPNSEPASWDIETIDTDITEAGKIGVFYDDEDEMRLDFIEIKEI